MAAEAAEAADEAPRALMMAAPRCCTVGMKAFLVPLAVHQRVRRLAVDHAEIEVGVLGRGMIAPDQHAADTRHVAAGLLGQLRDGAVVIETRHRGEIARVEIFGVGARDHGVGVGRIADHQYADIAIRHFVHGLALRREDLRVGHEQVLALHAGTARPGADQQRGLTVLEGHARIVGGDDPVERGERAVIEFHHHAGELRQGGRDLQQVQVHRGIGTQHLARSDTKGECVTNLASGPRDSDIDCGFHRSGLRWAVHRPEKRGRDSSRAECPRGRRGLPIRPGYRSGDTA